MPLWSLVVGTLGLASTCAVECWACKVGCAGQHAEPSILGLVPVKLYLPKSVNRLANLASILPESSRTFGSPWHWCDGGPTAERSASPNFTALVDVLFRAFVVFKGPRTPTQSSKSVLAQAIPFGSFAGDVNSRFWRYGPLQGT